MKTIFLFVCLCSLSTVLVVAQSRVSVAPTYWFNYNPYSYQFTSAMSSLSSPSQISQYNLVSSFGLSARYHFSPHWDVSTGIFYYINTAYLNVSPDRTVPFTSKGWQLPLLMNYRLTKHQVSPYFSAGALFAKSETFKEAPIRTDAVAGVGVDYRFNSSLSLLLQPTASYSFNRPTNDDLFQYSHYLSYSLGVQTQLIWHF